MINTKVLQMRLLCDARDRVLTWKNRILSGFKMALKKQLQISLRFGASFIISFLVLWLFKPNPVEYSIAPIFKLIDNQYQTSLWTHGSFDTYCKQPKSQLGIFWTQQCILSQNNLPTLRSNQVSITVQHLQPKKIRTLKLCRFISTINNTVCEQKFVDRSSIEMREISLDDVVILQVSLRLYQETPYFTQPSLTIHTNPNLVTLLMNRYYWVSMVVMATIFSLLSGLVLLFRDVYRYNFPEEEMVEYHVKSVIPDPQPSLPPQTQSQHLPQSQIESKSQNTPKDSRHSKKTQ